jgi:hypothetical protein
MIEASHHDSRRAYVVVDAHRLDDMEPYLFKTDDLGQSWKRLDAKLPRDVYLHVVREDPSRPGLLYVGTERGVVFSRDDGASWFCLGLNLPTVAVHDLQVKEGCLVVGTHGRSVWIFDHLPVVRNFQPETQKAPASLLPAPVATRWRYHSDWRGEFAQASWKGENPPEGARIYYWLGEKQKDEIAVEIIDDQRRLVRTLSSVPMATTGFNEYTSEEKKVLEKWTLPTKLGVNCAIWDGRWNGAEMIPGGKLDFGYPRIGPVALPGDYTVRLRVGGEVYSTALELRADPRQTASAEDLREQLTFALEVRETITTLTRTVEKLRGVRHQLATYHELLEKKQRAPELLADSQRLIAALDDLEGLLHNPKAQIAYDILAMRGGAKLYARLDAIFHWLGQADGPPPQGTRELFAEQKAAVMQCRSRLEEFVSQDLASYNQKAAQLGLPVVLLDR